MTTERSLTDRIAQVERKLELRRQRTARHWSEARAHVERATGWLPLLAVAGALAIGIATGRGAGPVPSAPLRKAGVLAPVAAIVATAMRFALSPQSRMLWSAVRSAREAARR